MMKLLTNVMIIHNQNKIRLKQKMIMTIKKKFNKIAQNKNQKKLSMMGIIKILVKMQINKINKQNKI